MAQSQPYKIFGVHSVTFFDRDTRLPEAYLRILGDCSIALEPEFEDLNGGSSLYPWDSEVKAIKNDLSMTAREYPISLLEMLLAGEVTDYEANAEGQINDFGNVYGTSCKHATTGVASIVVTEDESEVSDMANLKEGEYVLKVVSATTVDIYCLSDANFTRGTSKQFIDDNLKITASPLTITASTETEVEDFGFSLTGGSGTIGMTIGHTARFTVRRPSVSGVKVVVGQPGATFNEYGALISGQMMGDTTLQWMEIYRVKAAGMPINFKEKGYSEWSITLKPLVDTTKQGVFEFVRQR